jgi:hypothetical protein
MLYSANNQNIKVTVYGDSIHLFINSLFADDFSVADLASKKRVFGE